MTESARDAFRRNAGHLASVALVVMWSSGFVGAELGIRAGGTPLQLLGWRFSILGALLVSACLVLGVRLTDRRAWARQGVVGLFSQAVFLFMIFQGVALGVDGGTAALIAALQPLPVPAKPLDAFADAWEAFTEAPRGASATACTSPTPCGPGSAPRTSWRSRRPPS